MDRGEAVTIKLSDKQVEQIRHAATGYKSYAVFGERFRNGKPVYGVWFGHNKHGHPKKGESVRVTEQRLSLHEANDVIADMLVTDIIDILNDEYEAPSKNG